MSLTQQARDQYSEHIGGFYTSGSNYGKPYLRSGWRWPRVRFPAGGAIGRPYIDLKVHPAAVPYFQAVASIDLHHGYLFREWAGGTVSMRNITGASSSRIARQVAIQRAIATSLHAHGVARDINPSANPYGSSRPDELDQARWARLVLDWKSIETLDGLRPTRWGGDWTIDDDMHLEPTAISRSALEVGINFAEIPGWEAYRVWANDPTRPPLPPMEDGMSIKKGDPKSKGCAEIQKAMSDFFGVDNGEWDPWPGTSNMDGQRFGPGEDGAPGSTFEANVKAVQKALGLAETGVADGFTAAFILAKYGAVTGGSVSEEDLATAIKGHAAQPSAHPHKHDEGVTGGPVRL